MSKYVLTPKGVCFSLYLKKIIEDKWKLDDYIEEYEKSLTDMIPFFERRGIILDRKEIARTVLEVLGQYEDGVDDEDD